MIREDKASIITSLTVLEITIVVFDCIHVGTGRNVVRILVLERVFGYLIALNLYLDDKNIALDKVVDTITNSQSYSSSIGQGQSASVSKRISSISFDGAFTTVVLIGP
jgi:hypothetical protein